MIKILKYMTFSHTDLETGIILALDTSRNLGKQQYVISLVMLVTHLLL